MNTTRYIFTLLFCCFNCIRSVCQVPYPGIIKDVRILADRYNSGAKGILLNCSYTFVSNDSFQFNPIDSRFYMITTASFMNNRFIPINAGYTNEISKRKAHSKYIDGVENPFIKDVIPEMNIRKRDSVYILSLFIPYAAFNMPAGEQVIILHCRFDGNDAYGKRVSQVFPQKELRINMPVQRSLSLEVNAIEVNTLNSNGQAWDYSFFDKDAPDLQALLMVGGMTAATSRLIKNSYSFTGGFTAVINISDGDELRLLLTDVDLSSDDVIVNWKIETKMMDSGRTYLIRGTAENIRSCNIQYTVK